MAVKVLAGQTSSSSCERVNSEADWLKPLKSNKLEHAKHETKIYVHHNLAMLGKVGTVGYKDKTIKWDNDDSDKEFSSSDEDA